MFKELPIASLHSHPKNPRLSPRQDVVDQIAGQITAAGAFDQAHALIVRKNASGFEIISGHHRHLAAQKAGLNSVPCWVREMSDSDAYMALALNNAQGELCELEVGLHALGSGISQQAYGKQLNLSQQSIAIRVSAARVAESTVTTRVVDPKLWRHLAETHSAPPWLWRSLVSRFVAERWTVEQARSTAQRFKDTPEPPKWVDADELADLIAKGEFRAQDVKRFETLAEKTEATLNRTGDDADRLIAELWTKLEKKHPSRLSDAESICNAVVEEQEELARQRRQADMLRTKEEEEQRARLLRLRRNVSLEEWQALSREDREALLTQTPSDATPGSFNAQENASIEWAQWSWNPVTGCEHNCPYCYARDIAQSKRMADAYPNGFAPTFRPATVLAPRSMKVPPEAKKDTRHRNVFTCSMADLFGRWVPAEWINRVLDEMRAAPQWNFLCLTKFPKRMAEFDIPANAWMGTTVDCQKRVNNAEAAFAKVKAGVRWLSVEPMLTPLKFEHLDRFDWVVIGGSSRSSQTPEWVPPFEWVFDLVTAARAAGCKVYMKTNLGVAKRMLELPFDAPLPEPEPLPAVFDYLGKAKGTE